MTEIPQSIAARLQVAMLAGNEPEGSFLELRLFGDGAPEQEWFPVRDYRAAADRAIELGDELDVYVGAAPRVRQRGKDVDVERVWCLWADLDTAEAVLKLRALDPRPPVVIRSGSGGVHAYWPLRKEPISAEGARRFNRRLALALDGDMKATNPSRILRVAGTYNHKNEPKPVLCTRLETDNFHLSEVVGKLPDSQHYATPPVARVTHKSNLIDGLIKCVAEATEHERNSKLYWACQRVAEKQQIDQPAALAKLRKVAIVKGLPSGEVDRTIYSACGLQVVA